MVIDKLKLMIAVKFNAARIATNVNNVLSHDFIRPGFPAEITCMSNISFITGVHTEPCQFVAVFK